jgi:GT2 family glycosyltransferase
LTDSSLDVSIIIVSYNTCDYLDACLNSITKSVGDLSYEVIIVDNNSSDDSVLMVNNSYPDFITISSSTNLGFSAANNLGAKTAKGRYLLFLNPDTLVEIDTLTTMICFLDKRPGTGAASCVVRNSDGSVQGYCSRRNPSFIDILLDSTGFNSKFPNNMFNVRYLNLNWDRNDERSVDAISGAFFFIRSDLFHRLHGFDERYVFYVEDIDLSRRVLKSSFDIRLCPKVSIIHFGGKSSNSFSSYAITHGISSFSLYLYKYYPHCYYYIYIIILILLYTLLSSIYYVLSSLFNSSIIYMKYYMYRNIIYYIIHIQSELLCSI